MVFEDQICFSPKSSKLFFFLKNISDGEKLIILGDDRLSYTRTLLISSRQEALM